MREAKEFSSLMLAYVGDAVYELRVREHLLQSGSCKMASLHSRAVAFVKAERQSQLYEQIKPLLEPADEAVLRRARNAKSGHQPANISAAAYRRATGVEALIGYWHLTGEQAKLDAVFALLFSEEESAAPAKKAE